MDDIPLAMPKHPAGRAPPVLLAVSPVPSVCLQQHMSIPSIAVCFFWFSGYGLSLAVYVDVTIFRSPRLHPASFLRQAIRLYKKVIEQRQRCPHSFCLPRSWATDNFSSIDLLATGRARPLAPL